MKSKNRFSTFILIIIVVVLFYYLYRPTEMSTEEKTNEWIESGQAKVIIGDEEIPIKSTTLENNTHVILRDAEGEIITIISVNELFESINESKSIIVV